MNSVQETVVAERWLSSGLNGQDHAIPIRIFLPRVDGDNWACAYEIGWPSSVRRSEACGVDGVQALFLALNRIGAELYARPDGLVDLRWLEVGGGFGFPLPPSIRDCAIGEDRLM